MVTPAGVIGPAAVEVDDGRIIRVGPTTGPVPDRVLVPGLVDVQVNGIDDVDVASASGADWDTLDATWRPRGSRPGARRSSPPLDRYAALARIAEAAARPGPRPAIAGAHLEGPFLGGRPGAHRELIIPPDQAWLDRLEEIVVLVTIAPSPTAIDAIAALAGRGVS